MSEVATSNANAGAAAAAPAGARRMLLPALLIAVLAAAGTAAWFMLAGAGAKEPAPAQPIYFDVDSNLIVNFQDAGRTRFLQLGIQVMTREPAVVDRLTAHLPVVRNNLILLFSEQSFADLSSREGKATLRETALAEIQSVLAEHYGEPGVEALYFTSFVMQ